MPDPEPGRTRSRLKLLALIAVFVAPLALAWLWWATAERWGVTGDHVHNGELVDPPTPVSPKGLRVIAGSRRAGQLLDDRWTLIYADDRDCDEACREQLHYSRQVRIALGADRDRVQRLYLLTARPPEGLPDERLEGHDDLVVAVQEDGTLIDNLRDAGGPPPERGRQLYLVDPLGNLMLRFPYGRDPDGLLDDLERLLRLSRVG